MTFYSFDILGRFVGESEIETERSTQVKPDELTSDYNWNGVKWVFAPNIKQMPVTIQGQSVVSEPSILTHYQFLNLCQSVGGMTDNMLVACRQDPRLAAMWIKFDVAQDLQVGDPNVLLGLGALETLGYLPGGATAVIKNWTKVGEI